MLRECLIVPCDRIGEDAERLTRGEVRYLQEQHNVNLTGDSDSDGDGDAWFDSEEGIGDITILEELEYWERFGD